MPEALVFDRKSTAVLVLDYTNEFASGQDALLQRAASVLKGARSAGIPIVYVAGRFREGYPEVSPRNKVLGYLLKSSERKRVEGTPGAEVHPQVAPQPGEVLVIKRRMGAFSNTDLEAVLRAKGIDTLVILGCGTSGVVLSTVRYASDMDYRLVVLADCCLDRDEEVERVLFGKVFTRQATVVQSREFLEALEIMARP